VLLFEQAKSSCYSPSTIEQTAHFDHKPRTAWVFVRLLLHRRSVGGGCFSLNSQVKSSGHSPNFIETKPTNTATPRSSWAAAGPF